VRAELMQVDASRLVGAAERGRERVARASATLRAVGEEVRATASTVAGLSGMSERIGVFARRSRGLRGRRICSRSTRPSKPPALRSMGKVRGGRGRGADAGRRGREVGS